MIDFLPMSPKRKVFTALQSTGMLICVLLWWPNPSDIAWFTGIIAMGVALAANAAELKNDTAGEWVGLLVIVSHLMSIAVSGAAFGLEGTSSPFAVLPGLLGLLLWWRRPSR
ncbi:MAG: hypothetical protein ACPGYK_02210 [Flavobacteriales bacterium]